MALFGVGGVGLCAANAAAMSGCHPIIAVDILTDKLSLAQALGATHIVDASKTNPVDEILSICPGGVDFTLEATGRSEVMVQALQCARNQGGKAVVIGNAPYGEQITFDPRELNNGKQLLGTWGGDSVPDRDYPRYAKLIQAGKLNIEPLISRSYPLHEINQALDDLEAGLVARPMIDMTGA
jgi:S-(hydroxymethyl)glutathione dehydrogenase/alcohol dehydrogenase